MRALAGVSAGIRGALLLARGRPDGLLLVGSDLAGAARSFWALAVCAPMLVSLRLMSWAGSAVPADAWRTLGRDLLIFAVGWLFYAVLTSRLAPIFGRGQRWPQFIAAWNWCNVVENLLLVLGGIPALLGAPHAIDQVSQLVTTGWALWLEWYAARLALGVGPLSAAWLVLLDQFIGLALAGVALTMGGT